MESGEAEDDAKHTGRSKRERQLAEAEQALRQSKAVYLSLVETLPLAVFCKDREFQFIFGNERFCDSLNKPLEEFQGKTDFEMFPRELAEKYRRDDIKVLETGEAIEDLEEFSLADGTRREIHVLKGPIHDADGNIVGIQGMFWDVTEHKEALRASEARYRELFENANDMVYTADLDGRFMSLNKAGEETTGYTRDEVVGRDMSVLFAPEYLDKAREATLRKMTTHDRTTYEIEIVAKDGHRIPAEVGSRLIYEKGTPIAVQGIVRDITEHNRAEQQLRKAKETADAAKDAADAANRAKSEFVANMSHEIRTPMNGIIGMAQLLADTDLSQEQREYVDMVQQSAGSLLVLLNDILDFSKIEAGKLELEPIPFNLSDSVGKTVQTLSARAAEKGLELACRISPDLPERLIGDPGRLRQIVVNLVGNAIKFTERGEVVVEVESETCDNDVVVLHFSVRDTGIGIPEKKQRLIFDAFSQADASTTRRYGGTGLGLAISAQLVRMMEGNIWVESQVGLGTTFHFTAEFQISHDQLANRFHLESLSQLPVLIVDDNATNRRILEEMLKSWDLAPVVTDGGVPALAELQRVADEGRPYRLVLLDCMMPGMDGFSLAELIRDNAALDSPTIIMVSSAARPGDTARCRALGIVRHMTKPVIKSELFDTIVDALGEQVDESETVDADVSTTVGPSLHILLVEDGMINRRVATVFLEQAGHKVSLANNGREAVEVTARQKFDLVLMDVQMPIMDGHEATIHIRKRERETGGHLKIIAMTAAAMKGDREECLEAGMDAYLSKPINQEELFRTIAEHTRQAEPVEPSQADPDVQNGETSNQSGAIDFAAALSNLPSEKMLRDLAEIFLKECPQLINNLRTGLSQEDAVSVERAAHALRSSARIMAANNLRDVATEMEKLAKNKQFSDVAERLTKLQTNADQACNAIRNWL